MKKCTCDNYNGKTGNKKVTYPRCNRFYLLRHLNEEVDSLDFSLNVDLFYKDD